jgi:hypothetical protein
MTFSQVLNMVRDTANAVNPTGTFIHGRNSDAANAQDLPYPRIHLYPFTQDREPNDDYKRTSTLCSFHLLLLTLENKIQKNGKPSFQTWTR